MDSAKENRLRSTLDILVKVALRGEDISSIEEFIDKDFMAYGTAPDEKIVGKAGFRWMIERQRQELGGPSPEIERQPLLIKFFGQDDSALCVDEILIKVKDEDGTYSFTLRLTSVFEYDGNNWMLLHFHCSTPDANIREGSAWPIEEWKRKNAELELLVKEKTADLEHSLIVLRSTQDQLIQQEKLAGLGQLTAGIAHEIKNPLNFVNNFSELNLELIDEVFEELKDLERNETSEEINRILTDMRFNLKKIHQHGTRADGIVRSMLQHSRGGSGKVEPTDLNQLIREYVNLSFHGMRAGKKPINVAIELQLSEKVGLVPLIGEDFSRVILNLCNNAFDAMREKLSEDPEKTDYSPKLSVSTFVDEGQVHIHIEDNGPGIPLENKDKILQPFFTTKKGTEGTGLGLSITHDIIKAHKGKLDIDSHKGSYTRIMIALPRQ